MAARDAVSTPAHSPLLHGNAPLPKGRARSGPVLLDVNPSTLAIQTAGGFVERLLDKNAPIPIERSRVFTTARDDQTRVEIDCCRGENAPLQRERTARHSSCSINLNGQDRAATSRSR